MTLDRSRMSFEFSGCNRIGCTSCSFSLDVVNQGFVKSARLGLSVEFGNLAEDGHLFESERHVEFEYLVSLNFYSHQ